MIDRLPPTCAPSLILVVDDEARNIQLVEALLLRHGHHIISANSGPEALRKLDAATPDLILLDIMMPGMTGLELCGILQADSKTRGIPIIFLTGETDQRFVIDGLQQGAMDYITKPFHFAELLSRVDLHLSLQKARRNLAATITEKNRLLEIVAHDLKNPLSGIQFAALMLSERTKGADPQLDILMNSIKDSASRAFEIIASLLETHGLNEATSKVVREPVCLKENAIKALKNFESHVRSKNITLDFHSPPGSVIVLGEDRTLLCCLENLISNAIKFSPIGAKVTIEILPGDQSGKFRIEDQGPGIQTDEIDRMFQKFTRLSARPTAGEASTGLVSRKTQIVG